MAKPRVIISTDIGGSDPDDMESMAHALIYADRFDIKALISTPTNKDGRASDIHRALDAYAEDYANLKTWGNYATPEYLKSVVYQGNVNVPGPAGYSTSTPASQAIVKAADEAKAAGEALWVLTWGAMTDVAQALHDAPSIAGAIRVLSSNGWNGTQDPYSREYIYNNFRDLWWIESKSTHRGIYINEQGVEGNPFDMNEARGHGALGDYFYEARPWGVKMGDSWSLAYLTDQADDNNPRADSWGGTFVQNGHGPNFWTDDPDPAMQIGFYKGAAHVREHQNQIYQDMYKHFDRAKAANPDAGSTTPPPPSADNPVTGNDDPYKIDAGKTLWVNSRYFTLNDKGLDGGLKVTAVDDASATGVTVSWDANGTMVYRAKAGFEGVDTVGYTVTDANGSVDTAKVVITVGNPTSTTPEPTPEPPPPEGTGNPVTANDDSYKIDAGETLWVNSRYFTLNDKGEDGGLKVTAVEATSAAGVSVSWGENGTMVYRAKPGFEGIDTVGYTVVDADGSSDTAEIVITVGNPSSTTPEPEPEPEPEPTPPSTGTGNPVVAIDDIYKIDAGKTLYVNSRYFTNNDEGLDGGLKIAAVDAVSAKGIAISWGPEGSPADGTTVYKASAGFSGIDSFNYTVVDADGSSDIGTVFVHVSSLFV